MTSGTAGNDTLEGGNGDDTLLGLDGDDSLVGIGGNDSLGGGAGNDTLDGADGADTLTGAGGNDVESGGNGDDSLLGGAGNDSLMGGDGGDTLTGGVGDDSLSGGDGDDLFLVAGGAEHGAHEAIDGGAGYNVLRFTSALAGDTLVLSPYVTGIADILIGDAAGSTAGTVALNVNAAAAASAVRVTGNDGAPLLVRGGFIETLRGLVGVA